MVKHKARTLSRGARGNVGFLHQPRAVDRKLRVNLGSACVRREWLQQYRSHYCMLCICMRGRVGCISNPDSSAKSRSKHDHRMSGEIGCGKCLLALARWLFGSCVKLHSGTMHGWAIIQGRAICHWLAPSRVCTHAFPRAGILSLSLRESTGLGAAASQLS